MKNALKPHKTHDRFLVSKKAIELIIDLASFSGMLKFCKELNNEEDIYNMNILYELDNICINI